MKVLLIDVNCKNSSTGKIVYDLYNGIRDHGDEAASVTAEGQLSKVRTFTSSGWILKQKFMQGLRESPD